MAQTRKSPGFEIEDIHFRINQGFFGALLCMIWVLFAFMVLWAGIAGNIFWIYLPGAVLTLASFYPVWICIREFFQGLVLLKKRRDWIKSARRSEAAIIDRKFETNDYAETREEECTCGLALRLHPDEEALWVYVQERIYTRYKAQNTVWVYADAADPDIFILEGE
jgi:hypothetical protein